METDAATSGSLMVPPRHTAPLTLPAKHTHTHTQAHMSTHALQPACLTVLGENKCCSQERCPHAEYLRSLTGKQACIISLVSVLRDMHSGVASTFLILLFRERHSCQAFAQDLSLGKSSGTAEKRRTESFPCLRHRGVGLLRSRQILSFGKRLM